MKTLDKILELLCVILTIVFFGAVVVMVLGQVSASSLSMERERSISLTSLPSRPVWSLRWPPSLQ